MSRSPIRLPWTIDGGIGSRARIGLIVLETDQTVENEIRSLPLDDVAIHHARVPNDAHVTRDSLKAMEQHLPAAAGLLPEAFGFDVIGYACTSAATLIGDEGVARAIRSVHPDVPVTNPIRAAVAAFSTLGTTRIGVVTPYSEVVTLPVIDRFEQDGIEVAALGSYLIEDDLTIGRLSPSTIAEGVRAVGAEADCDAYFVSCTSVRLFADVASLEADIGAPVISSNLALAWHLLRLAGIDDRFTGLGTLFAEA